MKLFNQLLMFSTVLILSSCSAPTLNPPVLWVPVVDREICDKQKINCSIVNECREFHAVGDNVPPTYAFFASHPLKKCDGVFGVTARSYVDIKDYIRKLKNYIINLEANQCE